MHLDLIFSKRILKELNNFMKVDRNKKQKNESNTGMINLNLF